MIKSQQKEPPLRPCASLSSYEEQTHQRISISILKFIFSCLQ